MGAVADALEPIVATGAVPGLVAVVATDDDVKVLVLGDQAVGGAPMGVDSLFRIASAGKPFTAAAVLALVADGLLQFDDPVDPLLPELAAPRVLRTPTSPLDDTVPAARPITTRDMLRSTNGLGLTADLDAPVAKALLERLHQGPPCPQLVPPPDEWIAALAQLPLLHQPGAGFTYNTAFDVLGVLVARASGRPFADYVAERVLRPLGMDDTGFDYAADDRARATSCYHHDEAGDLALVDGPDGQWATRAAFASGAGGYVSTAADLLAFHRMLLAGGGDVLPASLVAAMTCDQLTPEIRATDALFLDDQSWGYGGGVDIRARQPWNVPGRYGWVGGTGTSAYHVPADRSVAILLTQVELGGPRGAAALEAFWRATAVELGHTG